MKMIIEFFLMSALVLHLLTYSFNLKKFLNYVHQVTNTKVVVGNDLGFMYALLDSELLSLFESLPVVIM